METTSAAQSPAIRKNKQGFSSTMEDLHGSTVHKGQWSVAVLQ